MGDIDNRNLREELESCKLFSTDTEMENGKHRVLNFNMSSFDMSLLNDKLDYVFKEQKFAAKINPVLGFVLKKFEEGMCTYCRNLCAHKLIRLTWNTVCRKWILLIFVPEKEPIQTGNFINLQFKHFLFRYCKMYPWVVKMQSYLNQFRETVIWIALLLREKQYNHIMTISGCLEH